MTISVAQQATWIRNFNPFSGDFRFPTINGIYEPMMIYNVVKGELQPWLATKYEWSADNKSLTFTLRDDVKWSDGQPFTAADVAYTFTLFKTTTGLQGPGGQAMNGDTAYVDTATATNPTTVVFAFKQVFTPGLYDIVAQNIVPQHLWKDVADPVKFTNENPVGTGPFTQVTVFQPQVFQVEKNPNYWQPGKPYIQGFRQPAYPGQRPGQPRHRQRRERLRRQLHPRHREGLCQQGPGQLRLLVPLGRGDGHALPQHDQEAL